MPSFTVEESHWLELRHPATVGLDEEGGPDRASAPDRKMPDLVVLAEQEADRTAEYARIAEMGAIAAAEAASGAERKREQSSTLVPLVRLAARKSQDAAASAAESSKIVDDLTSTVREEVTEAGRYDVTAIPRVDQASVRACKSSELAGASARQALSSAERVEAIFVGFEEEQAKKKARSGQGGVLAQPARSVRGRRDAPALPAQPVPPSSARAATRKPAAQPEKKGFVGRILDALTD